MMSLSFGNDKWVMLEYTQKWHYRDSNGNFLCGLKSDQQDNQWNLKFRPFPQLGSEKCMRCNVKLGNLGRVEKPKTDQVK